ncbi:MAG: hypothetical protein WC374_08445 [Phycisphaerae bacterium]|jgi:hypothetical protein
MNWLQIIIPIFTGLGGYFLKHFLDLKKEAEDRRFKDKRKHYRNLILCLKSLKEGKADNLEFLWFEYSFLWLHAPDTVINSFNKLLQTIQLGSNSSEDTSLLIGDLLVSIRHDMGFPKTLLKSEDFKGRLDKLS